MSDRPDADADPDAAGETPGTLRDVIPGGRVEAFSDGVIAVAITILVLDLTVPPPDAGGSLAHALLTEWPSYVGYAVSFLAIGIIWINHHTMLRRLAGVDHSVLILNLFLLMCIVVLPFSTSLLTTYLSAPQGGHLAAVVYAASFLVTSSVFLALQAHILLRRPHLLRRPVPAAERKAVLRRAALAPPAYLIAGALGLLSPYLTLAACAVMGGFYLRPSRSRRSA